MRVALGVAMLGIALVGCAGCDMCSAQAHVCCGAKIGLMHCSTAALN